MYKWLLPILPVFLLFTGCQSNPTHQLTDQEELTQQSVMLSTEFKRRGIILKDEKVDQYLESLTDQLLTSANLPRQSFRFAVLKNPVANALALPNGDIYLTTGLLVALENDDQLAAILAHEIGHVVDQHSLKSMYQREDAKLTANIADIFLLGTGVAFLPAKTSIASFSRDQEKQADLYGLELLANAGLNVRSFPDVFERFQTLPESMGARDSIYSSHPSNAQRIEYLNALADERFNEDRQPSRPSANFSRMQHRVLEEVVKIRLRQHQYQSAIQVLDTFPVPDNMSNLSDYYRAEAYRLMARHPNRALDEAQWLAGEDWDGAKNESYFENLSATHREQANDLFNDLANSTPPFSQAYKGLGLIAFEASDFESACEHFESYLRSGDRSDRLFIENLIKRCKRKSQ